MSGSLDGYPPWMSVLIVFNPISGAGRAKQRAEAIAPVLAAHGLEPTCLESRREPIASWLEEPLEDHDQVILVGGDGLVHAVAPYCAKVDVPLLHDPAGTENLFAREISGSPRQQKPEVVAQRLKDMDIKRVDLVEMTGTTAEGSQIDTTMVIVASVGIDADVVHAVDEARSGGITRLSYARPLLRSAFSWRGAGVTIHVDDEEVCRNEPAMVMIGNSRQYAGRLDPVRHAQIDSGLLDMVIMPARSGLDLAPYALGSWLGGSHLGMRGVRYRTGTTALLEFSEPSLWEVDGDPPPEKDRVTRLQARVLPGALPVVR